MDGLGGLTKPQTPGKHAFGRMGGNQPAYALRTLNVAVAYYFSWVDMGWKAEK